MKYFYRSNLKLYRVSKRISKGDHTDENSSTSQSQEIHKPNESLVEIWEGAAMIPPLHIEEPIVCSVSEEMQLQELVKKRSAWSEAFAFASKVELEGGEELRTFLEGQLLPTVDNAGPNEISDEWDETPHSGGFRQPLLLAQFIQEQLKV
jgi:hypothetical protein